MSLKVSCRTHLIHKLSPPPSILSLHFFSCCTGLQTISFTSAVVPDGCPAIKAICGNFLDKCTSLNTVDLRGLKNVEGLGVNAFANCITLEHIDCTPLISLKVIEKFFAAMCRSLKTVNFSGLAQVTTIQANVLCYRDTTKMPVLEMIDCRGMTALATVHRSFAEKDIHVQKDEGYPTPV
eukprot:TRINITY_DN5032_c0_g2_i10.p1 TRINITY_DN5032_c0_g2~~TRINITY_DN5032_c0_g2_i10.p1  ORF type:complete len:180 (+),score=7.22 TRINITY_DN5032_c0_g2_i10:1153-1692(+)